MLSLNLTLIALDGRGDDAPLLQFRPEGASWHLESGTRRLASYVPQDETITRPYWCNLQTTSGQAITRPIPAGEDEFDDHPTMHPGLWIAFGDVDGHDNWRLKAPVRHIEFLEPPTVAEGVASFVVRNEYRTQGGEGIVMTETSRWTARLVEDGWLLTVAARFQPPPGVEAVSLGDQEEMGLGVRLSRSLAERAPAEGTIRDADGRQTAAAIWGKPSAWCDGGRTTGERRIGVTIYPGGDNFRPCWWHVRDTGLMVANPFGRKALTGGEISHVTATASKPLDLRFAIRVYDSPATDAAPAFRDRAAEILESAAFAD